MQTANVCGGRVRIEPTQALERLFSLSSFERHKLQPESQI